MAVNFITFCLPLVPGSPVQLSINSPTTASPIATIAHTGIFIFCRIFVLLHVHLNACCCIIACRDLYFPSIPASSPIQQPSTNPPTAASTLSFTPSTPTASQPPESTTKFDNGDVSLLSTQGPDIASNNNEQLKNNNRNNISDSASKGSKNGAGVAAAVVIVLLVLIGVGVAVAIVVLVLYLRKRDKSLTNCFKGGQSGLFGIGEVFTVRLRTSFVLYTETL